MSQLYAGAVASTPRAGFTHRFGSALRAARLMVSRARERRILAGLDARELRDIGITPYEAGMEARKPFWRS